MPQGHYGFSNILQLVRTTSLKVLGKPGATAGAGLAGGTTSGAPTTGQFEAGDAVVAQNGHLWICTVSGSPGTWVDAGASGGYTDPLTTRGDLVVRGAASTGRLALGTSGYILTSDGTDAAWAAAGAGFADPMSTRGDLIVRGGSGTTRLALGASGLYLKSDGTDAVWAAAAAASLTTASANLGSDTSLGNGSWTDLCSVSLVAGTWMLWAGVDLESTSGTPTAEGRITDGTTHYGSCESSTFGTTTLAYMSITSEPITLGSTTTLKLQGIANTANAKALATTFNQAQGKATYLRGLKVA